MSEYQVGQKLIYTPDPILDDPYPDSKKCTYVGRTDLLFPVIQFEDNGFLKVVAESELTIPKKVVALWDELTKHLEDNYDWSWEDDYDRRKTAKDWVCSLRELGVDIPCYVEVDDVCDS